MAVWSVVQTSKVAATDRIDAEYYMPDLLRMAELLEAHAPKVTPLGDLIADGVRVVYQNTEILDAPDAGQDYVRFLQATDVSTQFPTLDRRSVGWVTRRDWDRYPKGRIRAGEILIEVKGKAEKVALVPDDYPSETLVSGSLYKAKLRQDTVEPEFVVAYLLSRFGRGFRQRCLTNTLIGYVNKGELYAIPVPILTAARRKPVTARFRQGLASDAESDRLLQEAEAAALVASTTLGPVDAPELSYTVSSSRVWDAARLDAEYFQPTKWSILDRGRRHGMPVVGDYFSLRRESFDPTSLEPSAIVRNFDLSDALRPFLDDTKDAVEAGDMRSTKLKVKTGDLVVSRLRSYLREIALVQCSADPLPVVSTEFLVLRPNGTSLSAQTLLAYLRGEHAQAVFAWSQDGSNHPRFGSKELLNLPVPTALLAADAAISELVRNSIEARQEALLALDDACELIETALGLQPHSTAGL